MRTLQQIPEQQQEDKNSTRRGFLSKLAMSLAGVSFLAPFLNGSEKKNSTVAKPLAQDPFIGEIFMVAFNFAPDGFLLCDGSELPISQNGALFSLLGTRFGGNGTTTFNLPDLRGRVAVGMGTGPGLTNRILGQTGGAERHQLSTNELPGHSHPLSVDSGVGLLDTPTNAYMAKNSEGVKQYSNSSNNFGAGSGITGGNGLHNNMQPFVTMNYIIAVEGVFPTRS